MEKSKRPLVVVVWGTRPEAIKLTPFFNAVRKKDRFDIHSICTGQHSELLLGAPVHTPLAMGYVPHTDLLRPPNDERPLSDYLRWLEIDLRGILERLQPSLVVVQGDTASALAGARAAGSVPVAHIEAGVRSHNLGSPYPEEKYRREIDQLASLRLAPTNYALTNLAGEGLTGIWTGNTVVDMVKEVAPRMFTPSNDRILTLHRRELREDPNYDNILAAISDEIIKKEAPWLSPRHPGTKRAMQRIFQHNKYVSFRDPWVYNQALYHLRRSPGILTDSGGLVEEAVTLGVPVAILRNSNDRIEAEHLEWVRRFEVTPFGARQAVSWLLEQTKPAQGESIFGNGNAGELIEEEVWEFLND